MRTETQEYRGRRIEVRIPGEEAGDLEKGREAEPQLLINGEHIRYDQLSDGSYALQDYAYDWQPELMELARKYIDYQELAEQIRRNAEPNSEI